MNAKVTSIVTYIPVLGCIIAILAGDKEDSEAKFNINQSILMSVIMVAVSICASLFGFVLGFIPVIGAIVGYIFWVIDVLLLITVIIAAVRASQDQRLEIPVVSTIEVLK